MIKSLIIIVLVVTAGYLIISDTVRVPSFRDTRATLSENDPVGSSPDDRPRENVPVESTTPLPSRDAETEKVQETLRLEYESYKKKHSLKYASYSAALAAFRAQTGYSMIFPRQISYYVPGKLPHEDGDPYFVGVGVISEEKNQCVYGYMNLVTGASDAHTDVCVIVG